ncbi:MAG TPA: aspartate aminotransferase family protein [Clostridia bacterium]|nr:aspartate aminotransferase family protein [Clostridia bacterium]
MSIFSEDKQYIAGTYNRFPVNIQSGKGSIAIADDGKEYIDFASGIAVNSFGFCDSEWVQAITKQINSVQHTSNLYYTSPCVELAKLLVEKTGLKKVFLSNSGAEANECAIKTARKYSQDKKGKDYYKILTLNNSFHGRTITTLAATGQEVFHKDFTPLTEGFVYANANDIADLNEKVAQNKLAAIMIEVVQGEGGINVLEQSFVDEIVKLANQNDLLIIVDEVQTGNGRTGKFYGYMHFGFTPDIVTTAKGLGGGLPIGATIFGEKTCDVLGAGNHGSTFGGNPVCAAGAVSIVRRIDQDFMQNVAKKSQYIIDELKDCDGVVSVSGLGLMLGVEVKANNKEIVNKCIEKGLLVLTAKNKLRLLPALNISDELLKKGVDILKQAIAEVK